MALVKLIHFPVLHDARGAMVALEATRIVPFDIRRVYYIFDTKAGVSRGFHAHKALRQIAICLRGKCRITLDNGTLREDVWLDEPTKGLVIDDMIWREMHDFSSDCVLMVLANKYYDESDYIRSYEEFKRLVK